MAKCYFVHDNIVGQVLIPECWTVVMSNDIDDCTCQKSKPFHVQIMELKEENKLLKQQLNYVKNQMAIRST